MRNRGFTLLELLVALSIASLVFVGMNFFVFSMGELWGRGGDKRLFDQHVRAVTRFLERELSSSAFPPAQKAGASAFTIEEIKPSGGLSENLVTYELLQSSRLFDWPDRPLPELICSLLVREGKGLYILHHSRLETKFEEDAPREVLVTPFITGLSYQYYDSDMKRWTEESSLKKDNTGAYLVPNRLQLKFSHKGMTREVLLSLPSAMEGATRP